MPGSPRVLRVVMVAILALLGGASPIFGQGRTAIAYWPFDYLDGLEQTITRYYSRSEADDNVVSLEVSATVARFDGEDTAATAWDEITAAYAGGYASYVPEATPEASDVAGLGDASAVFTSVAHEQILLEWYMDISVMVTRDATDIVIVSVQYQTVQEPAPPVSPDLARALTETILAAPAGDGEPVADADGNYRGGLWERLPTLDHEVLAAAGLDFSLDGVDFPEPVSADEGSPESDESDDGTFDFSTLEGIQRGVGREYSGDMSALQTPETAPAGIYYLIAALAEFDSEDHAATALDSLYSAWMDSIGQDETFTLEALEPGEIGDIGDRALGARGGAEEDGLTLDVVLLAVQDGAVVYLVATVGAGEASGSLDVASRVVQTSIEADASDGDGVFDENGGSTGGLWDKLPAEDDPLLAGLTPTSDVMLYPDDPEG